MNQTKFKNKGKLPVPYRLSVRRAFTLIELLIVVSIICIISGAVLSLTTGLSRSEERLRTAMEVEESEAMARARWRGDILTAQAVTLTPEKGPGRMPSLAIRNADTTIVYRIGKAQTLERVAGAGNPETLASGVESLGFDPIGQGWRMRWRMVDDTGLGQRRVWNLATFATPLAPEAKER